MKNKLQSPVGLNAGGVGPKIIRRTLPVIALAIFSGIAFPEYFNLPFIETEMRQIFGIVMLSIGLLIYFGSVYQFLKAFPKGKLVKSGFYRVSRNPVYASWILLILPSIALISDNWLFFLSAFYMYVVYAKFIKNEEETLEKAFGQEYLDYKKKVKALILV